MGWTHLLELNDVRQVWATFFGRSRRLFDGSVQQNRRCLTLSAAFWEEAGRRTNFNSRSRSRNVSDHFSRILLQQFFDPGPLPERKKQALATNVSYHLLSIYTLVTSIVLLH